MEAHKNKILFTCPMSNIMPIIRPVGNSCNLKCAYCYYNSSNQTFGHTGIISDEALKKFISQFIDLSGEKVTFVWHGGEPLLAGIDFYKRVVELENLYKRPEQTILNDIQTNGTLINEDWASFLKENDFHIGMSLDGIQCCHDHFRKNQNSDGSFSRVIAAIELLRKHDLEPGILQTVTKYSLPYIEDNFDYFVEILKFKKWAVNVYNDIGNTNPLMKGQSLSNEDYFFLYRKLFDLWVERNDPSLEIREINTFVSSVLGKYSEICQNSGICSSFIAVSPDGSITPTCESYYFDDEFKNNSNILNRDLLDILNDNQRLTYSKVINYIPSECKQCKWHSGCFNGCTIQRDANNHFVYCEGRKKLFSYLYEVITKHL